MIKGDISKCFLTCTGSGTFKAYCADSFARLIWKFPQGQPSQILKQDFFLTLYHVYYRNKLFKYSRWICFFQYQIG